MPFELNPSHVQSLLNAQRKLEDLMPAILDIILELTGAERGFLMLYDRERELAIQASRDCQKQNLESEQFLGSNSIVRKVVDQKQTLYIPVLPINKDFSSTPSVRAMNLQSVICFPLWSSQKPDLLGVLYIDSSSKTPSPLLKEGELKIMEGLANHVAVSIENAQLFEELEEKNKRIDSLNLQLQKKVDLQEGKLSEMQMLLEETQRELAKRYDLSSIVGKSLPMQRIFRILEKVVQTHATVLIHGESGTGKELVAKYIHHNGPRAAKPLVSINCAAFNEELLESELFGHRKGAFTGADQNKIGVFQLADGGTLFLDEVGDMSPEMQKKLLRTLQNGEIRPVGAKEVYKVDVRIVAASNRNLQEMVQQNAFREDLFYRLNVINVTLPPLRERGEDIPLLIEHYSKRICNELQIPLTTPSSKTMQQFVDYDWPGNVRELENELRRYFILESEYHFDPNRNRTESGSDTLDLSSIEKNTIQKAMDLTGGNKTRAAELLGIPLRTLYEKLKRYSE
jgi:serine/threonine-protein kinase PknK